MDVWWNGKVIGNCTVKKNGLYTEISCRCPIVSKEICRLYAVSQQQRITVGVLRPEKGCLTLFRKISDRQMPAMPFIFSAEDGTVSFFPVWDGGSFPCVEKLSQGKWETRGGIHGICISSSTGQ